MPKSRHKVDVNAKRKTRAKLPTKASLNQAGADLIKISIAQNQVKAKAKLNQQADQKPHKRARVDHYNRVLLNKHAS